MRRLNICVGLLLVICLPTLARAQTLQGKVIGVSDGDTITVLDAGNTQHRIRLDGIDAPESRQAFGQRSKQSLSDMVFGKNVEVQSNKKDRYGRTVGKVLAGGWDINLAQIKAGMAWHYKQYANEQAPADRAAYAEAEDEARAARRGLWVDGEEPTPPWAWRRNDRQPKQPPGSLPRGAPQSPVRLSAPSAGREYIRGPRGGCYYLSSSGRKVYVDRSLCN